MKQLNSLTTPFFRCKLCGWPLCSESCVQSENHRAECVMSQKREKPITLEVTGSKRPTPLYEVVAILRCMYLKQANEDKYNNLMKLEAHTQERMQSGK